MPHAPPVPGKSQDRYIDELAREYFGEAGMPGYVEGVQRQEIRRGIACIRHRKMSDSDIGDDRKEYSPATRR